MNFAEKNLSIFSVVILLFASLAVNKAAIAVDFDPFGSNETDTLFSPKDVTDGGPVIPQIEFNNNDISMAFQIISDATGWSIFPTVEVSRAKVSLWAKDITARELLDTVVTLAGFIYHRQGNVITVMTYNEYMQHYGLAKKIIPITYANAASVAAVIKPFLTKLSKSVVHKESNTIVLYEADANLEFIAGIIEKLDTPAEDIVVEVINLEYADAEALSETLVKVFSNRESKENVRNMQKGKKPSDHSSQQMVKPMGEIESALLTPQAHVEVYSIGRANKLIIKAFRGHIEKLKKLIEKLDTYVEPTTKNYHFTYVDAAEIYTGLGAILENSGRSYKQSQQKRGRGGGITLVEKTNSILLTGPPSVHRIMTSITESVNVPGEYETGIIRVYKIENADVDEIAKTIQELIQSEGEQKGKAGEPKFEKPSDGGLKPGPADMAETEEFVPQIEAKVSVNKATNSIVVQATARQHRELEKLIEELDMRRKQVLIEALIVKITTNDDMDLGIELNHIGGDVLAFTSFGLFNINPVTGVRDIVVGPGGTAAVLRPDRVQAILKLLQSSGNVRIESAPRILVNDNAVGTIVIISE